MLCSNVLSIQHKNILICNVQSIMVMLMSTLNDLLISFQSKMNFLFSCVVQDHTYMLFSNSNLNICHLLLLRTSRTRCSIMVLCQQQYKQTCLIDFYYCNSIRSSLLFLSSMQYSLHSPSIEFNQEMSPLLFSECQYSLNAEVFQVPTIKLHIH